MIKRYWPYVTIAILLAIVCWQQNCINNHIDENIAAIAREKVMQRETAKQKEIADKFKAANKPLIAENIKLKKELISVGINAGIVYEESERRRLELLKIKDCPKKADGLNLALMACNDFTLKLKNEYSDGVDKLNLSCAKIVESKEREISDLNALHGEVVTKLGDCTAALVIAKLEGKQRISLGFFAGYDPLRKQATVGFGITFRIIRLPKFLGGIL